MLDRAKDGEAVYLISNTNPLNIEKILSIFERSHPDIHWDKEAVHRGALSAPIAIAPNVYLCLSYQYGLFKEGTPGLLKAVSDQVKEKVTVVSQYPKDREIAKNLELTCMAADEFYAAKASSKLLHMG